MAVRPSGIVTLTTDFGGADPYVAILKGALLRTSDKPRIVDVTHDVPPQDLACGAFVLWSLRDRFPAGTVHVAVVDPGVGTSRGMVAVAAHGQFWIAPDNGLLGAVLRGVDTLEVRGIDLVHLGLQRQAQTFDGRDVFAPVAAMLASGRYGFRSLGPQVELANAADPVFDGGLRVVHVDRYGNLITNVAASPKAPPAAVELAGRRIAMCGTYGDAAAGDLLAYVGSFGLLEVARRDGSAAELLGIGRGAPITPLPA